MHLQEMDALASARRQSIVESADELAVSGQTYYVNADGSDENNGRTPETAWRSLQRVSQAALQPGDGVLFRRGDVFRGAILTRPGVCYGAYGTGEKPRLYGWERDLADPALWTLADASHHIWQMKEPILDSGTLVFNHGQRHCRKLIPSYIGGRFVCRNDESRPFDMAQEMTQDLDLYWHFDSILTTRPSRGETFPIPEMGPASYGTLYLRCDAGNPGVLFESIEALPRRAMFQVGENSHVRIDNLCLKYIGLHAIAAGGRCVRGLHVTNCEIGWIGGTIQHYLGTDPNYPQGGRGTVTRFGNGVEIYGGCEDYLVKNCWIYQAYDAGITHQITTGGQHYELNHIRYTGNLVESCVYGIEYFLEKTQGDATSSMNHVLMEDNILRLSGYGWGQQRHNTDTPALIKGWSYENTASDFIIRKNVFDRCAYRMLHLVAREPASLPVMEGNTYVQTPGGCIGQYGANHDQDPPMLIFDEQAEKIIQTVLGDAEGIAVSCPS